MIPETIEGRVYQREAIAWWKRSKEWEVLGRTLIEECELCGGSVVTCSRCAPIRELIERPITEEMATR